MIEHQIPSQSILPYLLVLIVDIVCLNLLCFGLQHFAVMRTEYVYILWNVSYLISVLALPPLAFRRITRTDWILSRSSKTGCLMGFIFFFLIRPQTVFFLNLLLIFAILCISMMISRVLGMRLVSWLRRRNIDNCNVIYVGAGVNLRALFDAMNYRDTGYKIHGYFEKQVSKNLGQVLTRLGDVEDVIPYLERHHVDILVCNLDYTRTEEIRSLMNYCENNMIKFYAVPNIHNYVGHTMQLQFVNEIPVMSMRSEPLVNPINRIIKRTFDIVFSTIVLISLSWLLVIVAVIIKISSPGPIIFRQDRTGRNGKTFKCLKFRSMKVNADADKLQATENDPRKYPFGDFMRRTSIDELPQFFNVLKGDMSVVGPRPHMLAHNKMYGDIIQGYMVRHFAKPGITGWAQVNGFRGETKETWQMEERVKRDIWYLENWTFFLDVRIVWKTFTNIILRRETTAY